jgi:hypothetical protein
LLAIVRLAKKYLSAAGLKFDKEGQAVEERMKWTRSCLVTRLVGWLVAGRGRDRETRRIGGEKESRVHTRKETLCEQSVRSVPNQDAARLLSSGDSRRQMKSKQRGMK